jgi:hypothetical protein
MNLRIVILLLIYAAIFGCLSAATPLSGVSGTVTDYPIETEAGEPVTIKWFLNYPKNMSLTHSAIHYGYFSHAGELGLDVFPNDLEYSGVVEVFPDDLSTGNNFRVTLVPHQNGTLYFRAHAVLDKKSFWSEEFSIEVQ